MNTRRYTARDLLALMRKPYTPAPEPDGGHRGYRASMIRKR